MENKQISKYLGKEVLLSVIEKIRPDEKHPQEIQERGILVLNEKPKTKPHHYFSAPYKIEEKRFIIYHFKSVGRGVGRSEFIIYCIYESENVNIEKTFVLWEH